MQNVLLKLNLRLAALGTASLVKVSQMSQTITLILCVFIYLQVSSLILTEQSLLNGIGFIGFLTILLVSFICKLITAITIMFDTGQFLLKFSYFILQLSSGFFRCIDIVCFVSLAQLQKKENINKGLFGISAFNVVLSLTLYGISEIIQFNYAFINPNPYKNLLNIKTALINELLQIAGFVLIGMELPGTLWFLRPLIQFLTVLSQLKCILYDLPYNYDYLALSNIIKMAFQFGIFSVFMLSNSFDIVGSNKLLLILLIIFLLSLSVFSVWKSRKTKILNQDIQEFAKWHMAFVKISWFSELLQQTGDTAKTLLFLCYGSHQITCKDPTCPCKTKDKNVNFRLDRGSKDSVNQEQMNKMSLMYFLLNQAENAKKMFSQSVCTHLLHLSSLSLLHLYPRLLYEVKLVRTSFNLNTIDESIVNFIMRECLDLINENSKKKGMAFVEHIRIYEDSIGSLKKEIQHYCQNRVDLWSLLRQPMIEANKLDSILILDASKRKSICEVYDKILQNINTYEVWNLMYAYSHYITKDYKLQTRLVKENRKILNFSNFFEAPLNHARFLADHDNTCVIEISIDKEKLGTIVWYSDHFRDLFKPAKNMLGQRIELLMPTIYRDHHAKILERWLGFPVNTKIGRFNSVYIRSSEVEFMAAKVYIKVVTKIDRVQLIGMVTKTDDNEYLVIDEQGYTVNQPKQLLFLFQKENHKKVERINFCLISLNLLELLERSLQSEKELFTLEFVESEDYWSYLRRFEDSAEQLQQIHTNRETYLKALQNLMKYYGSIIESAGGTIHQLRCEVRRIQIGDKTYTVLGYTRFERGSGDVNLTKMNCKTTVRGLDMDLASSTTTNRNDMVENRSSSIMSEQSDATVKKDLLSTYMSRSLRILGFCSIFYLLSAITVEIVKFSKIDKDITRLLVVFDNYKIITEAAQAAEISYGYGCYMKGLQPEQKRWFLERSLEMLQEIKHTVFAINNGQANQTLVTIEFLNDMKIPITLGESTDAAVTYNVFFEKFIFQCTYLIHSTYILDTVEQQGIDVTWYNYLRLINYQESLNGKFRKTWVESMSILVLYFLIGSALFYLFSIMLLGHICYYVRRARKHHQSILETLMSIETQNLSKYEDTSRSHLDQIRRNVREFKNLDEGTKKTKIKPYNRVMYHSQSLVAHKIILLALLLTIPLAVAMPFVSIMKETSLKLADGLADMVESKQEVNQELIALIYQDQFKRKFNAQKGSEIIDFEKGYQDSLLNAVRDIIEESKKYPEKDDVIALFSDNICLSHSFREECMKTEVLQTGLLANYAMISHKLQDAYHFTHQDNTTILRNYKFFRTIVESAYHIHRHTSLTVSKIVDLIKNQPKTFHPIAQTIFILNILIVLLVLSFGFIIYRKEKHSYHLKCMYLSVVPDDEFRFNVNLEILLSRIKEQSYLEYN